MNEQNIRIRIFERTIERSFFLFVHRDGTHTTPIQSNHNFHNFVCIKECKKEGQQSITAHIHFHWNSSSQVCERKPWNKNYMSYSKSIKHYSFHIDWSSYFIIADYWFYRCGFEEKNDNFIGKNVFFKKAFGSLSIQFEFLSFTCHDFLKKSIFFAKKSVEGTIIWLTTCI